MFYYLFFFLNTGLKPGKKKQYEDKQMPISVVICARNENENLKRFLPDILEQKYPEFEVIVVNDCSSDNSAVTLHNFAQKYPHLYYTNIYKDKKFEHGKKLALTVGIKAAKNDLLLLTDADCKPASENWIATIQRNFTENCNLVLSYGGYFKTKGLLNRFIRFDTVFTAMQFLGFARAGVPYMGVGRNLAYRKSLFFKAKGFASHISVISGDDDLFVNENAKKENTNVELSYEGFTYSEPKQKFKDWIRQKQRHFSTGIRYKKWHKIILGLEIMSRMIFFAIFTYFLIVKSTFWYVFLSLFFIRFLIQNIVFYKVFKKLKALDLIFFGFILDFILPFINLYAFIKRVFLKNKNSWR